MKYTHLLNWHYGDPENPDVEYTEITEPFTDFETMSDRIFKIMMAGERLELDTYFEEYSLEWLGSRFHAGVR